MKTSAESTKPPLTPALSTSDEIAKLSIARLFLLPRHLVCPWLCPVFLDEILGWSFQATGAAAWVISGTARCNRSLQALCDRGVLDGVA